MSKELRQWAPSRWSPAKRESFTWRVHLYSEEYLRLFLGAYEGNLVAAVVRNERFERESRERLANLGVKTMGQS